MEAVRVAKTCRKRKRLRWQCRQPFLQKKKKKSVEDGVQVAMHLQKEMALGVLAAMNKQKEMALGV